MPPDPSALKVVADTVLEHTVSRAGGVPGVVAVATNRSGNFYEGAAGVRELGSDQPMTLDSVLSIGCVTQPITGTCIMQLVEAGNLSLEDPAKNYVREIAELRVLESFDAAGMPRTRPPKRDITIKDLMSHSSGLGYEFFGGDDLRYRVAHGIPPVYSASFDSIRTVLQHDPGERWTYGVGVDWLGRIVETVRDRPLGEVMKAFVFDPLGMTDIGFGLTESMRARRATIHARAADGKLKPLPDLVMPDPPQMAMGGHGLYASVSEFCKFIRMMLNDGAGPRGRVLQASTVERMSNHGRTALRCAGWTTAIPSVSNSGEFFPGLPKSWAYTFMVNNEPTPSGRAAGSLMGAGLTNCYFWIDRSTGIGGCWGSQILPFQDVASYPGFVDFETVVYRHHGRS